MMNLTINTNTGVLEIEVFGAYQPDRIQEVLDAMKSLAMSGKEFSVLELHHMQSENFMKMLFGVLQAGNSNNDLKFMKKLKRYAIVADDPPIMLRLVASASQGSKRLIRIFEKHEIDAARLWVEGRDPKAAYGTTETFS